MSERVHSIAFHGCTLALVVPELINFAYGDPRNPIRYSVWDSSRAVAAIMHMQRFGIRDAMTAFHAFMLSDMRESDPAGAAFFESKEAQERCDGLRIMIAQRLRAPRLPEPWWRPRHVQDSPLENNLRKIIGAVRQAQPPQAGHAVDIQFTSRIDQYGRTERNVPEIRWTYEYGGARHDYYPGVDTDAVDAIIPCTAPCLSCDVSVVS